MPNMTGGLLEFSNDIRDNMLKMNVGKYSQWKKELFPAIGEYYDIDYNRKRIDQMSGKSIFEYTNDGKSDYSKEIERRNFQFGERETYSVRPLLYEELNPWLSFQGGSYIQYIDDVLGKDFVMRHVDYINNLLSGQFIENALRQSEVGVIHDVNVAVAMLGVITTNPNNMSGKDTVLGSIGNRMYAQTLYNGAIFNSDRMKAKIKIGDEYYDKTYITPYLVNKYGNNLANVFELSDTLKLGIGETHIREDLGGDVFILDGYKDGNESDSSRVADLGSDEFLFLREQINNARNRTTNIQSSSKSGIISNFYSAIKNEGYIKNSAWDDYGWRFKELSIDDYDDRKNELSFYQYDGIGAFGEKGISQQRTVSSYVEPDNGGSGRGNLEDESALEPNEFDFYSPIGNGDSKSLITKTNELFNKSQIKTMIARFHTGEKDEKSEFTDTARSYFGNSHGRNLLVLDATLNKAETNGYSNPYCRTWTFHHQYNQVKKLIRPFVVKDNNNNGRRFYSNKEIQSMNRMYRAYRKDGENEIIGYESLAKNTVLQNNGFVRITPQVNEFGKKIDKVKNCMFSIENLAWKDVLKHEDNISEEQTGPNGGRIMWFPPYDLDFNETVGVSWNPNTFIGRGEPVYTYSNTERGGSLSFSLLIDHPAIVNTAAKTNYKGEGVEQDADADILRFFSGCQTIKEPVKKDEDVKVKEPVKKEVPKPKEYEFKVKIYFPNNFSGIVTNKYVTEIGYDYFGGYVQTEKSENGGTTDMNMLNGYRKDKYNDYWWQYLLVGNNTCIPSEEKYFRGYEMLNDANGGLTDTSVPFMNNKKLYACKPLSNGKSGNEVGVRKNENKYTCTNGLLANEAYTYQVDDDLHQKLKHKGSYDDPNSFRLNVSFDELEKTGKKRSDNEYTFSEFIMAMLQSSNDEYYNKLYNKYKTHVIDKCGTNKENIDKLYKIFSDRTFSIKSMSYSGSADKNDAKNSNMLATRRGEISKGLLRRILNNGNDISYEGVKNSNSIGGSANKPAFDFEQKSNRFCEIIVRYEINPSGDLSNGGNGGNTSGDVGNTITFEEYMNRIKECSPVISTYMESIADKKYDNGAFLKSVKEKGYNEFIKKGAIDITDDKAWKSEVDNVVNNCMNRDAVVAAYATSYGTNNNNIDFRECIIKEGYGNFLSIEEKMLFPVDYTLDNEYLDYVMLSFVGRGITKETLASDSPLLNAANSVKAEIGFLIEDNFSENKTHEKKTVYNKELTDYFKKDEKIVAVNEKYEKFDENIKCFCNDDYQTVGIKNVYVYVNGGFFAKLCTGGTIVLPKDLRDPIVSDERYISLKNEYFETITLPNVTIKKNVDGTYEEFSMEDIKSNKIPHKMISGKSEVIAFTKLRSLLKDICSEMTEKYKGKTDNAILADEFCKGISTTGRNGVNEMFSGIIKHFITTMYSKDSASEYTVKENLYKYNSNIGGNDEYETYLISVYNTLPYIVLGHLVQDTFEDYDIVSNDKDRTEYLLRFMELATKFINDYPEYMKNIIEACKKYGAIIDTPPSTSKKKVGSKDDDYEISGGDKDREKKIEEAKDKIKKAYSELVADFNGWIEEDGTRTEGIIERLNKEIKREEEITRENAKKKAQEIEQERKKTLANMEAARLKEESQVMKYGPDNWQAPNLRYETEAEYFQNLKEEDPLVYKSIKEKFKHFNPAFHSMSPEGFNARLTFLHQCTRQGGTDEVKVKNGNKYTGTASNLAFGRMPVCVLRIGDFINTRIIIESMSISYASGSGIVWDLNSEGAGVQPMYAKVQLGIKILGGQSLDAPISRLQNALSFNYYANTESYDNRSDVAVYSNEGEKPTVEYKRIWSPLQKEYEWADGANGAKELKETGRLVNNYTDNFKESHNNDGTWKDLTDEQLTEGFAKK